MIEWKNVSLTVGGRSILRDITLTAKNGEILVLLGENGSGKTSLLRTAQGRGYAGSVLLDGKESGDLSPALRAKYVSCMTQTTARPPVTAEELVMWGRTPYLGFTATPGEKDRELVRRALSDAGAEAFSGQDVRSLSGGEFQKVCFAALLAQDTPSVLLDEPAAHLDRRGAEALYGFLRRLRASGKAVVCVLHDLTAAWELGDRLAVLREGRLAFSGTREELLAEHIPETVFGCRVYSLGDTVIIR